jgi:hypothetical protein
VTVEERGLGGGDGVVAVVAGFSLVGGSCRWGVVTVVAGGCCRFGSHCGFLGGGMDGPDETVVHTWSAGIF